MKKGWVKNIFRGLCLSSAVFVFQACYGTPQDFGQDVCISGVVKSKKTGEPLEGIKVYVDLDYNKNQSVSPLYEYTDIYGGFTFYSSEAEMMRVTFEDVDPSDGKDYVRKDTIFKVNSSEILLNIELDEN